MFITHFFQIEYVVGEKRFLFIEDIYLFCLFIYQICLVHIHIDLLFILAISNVKLFLQHLILLFYIVNYTRFESHYGKLFPEVLNFSIFVCETMPFTGFD